MPEPEITSPTDVIVRAGTASGLPFTPGHETAAWCDRAAAAGRHARRRRPAGLRGHDRLRRGEEALPHACPGSYTVALGAGGLGHIGIQALRALSQTEIIVVDRSAEALEHARGWGADQIVQAKEDGSHVQEVKDITGGGAQVVLDFVGERDAVLMLGTRGVDVLVGYGGRLDVEILSEGLFPETSFLSSIVGAYNEAVELVALVTKTTFPLEGVNDALHALDEGRMIGRGVLVPTSPDEIDVGVVSRRPNDRHVDLGARLRQTATRPLPGRSSFRRHRAGLARGHRPG